MNWYKPLQHAFLPCILCTSTIVTSCVSHSWISRNLFWTIRIPPQEVRNSSSPWSFQSSSFFVLSASPTISSVRTLQVEYAENPADSHILWWLKFGDVLKCWSLHYLIQIRNDHHDPDDWSCIKCVSSRLIRNAKFVDFFWVACNIPVHQQGPRHSSISAMAPTISVGHCWNVKTLFCSV